MRIFRESKGINIIQFSNLLNISQSSLSAIENNKSNPSATPTKNLIHKFDINIYWLFTGKGEMLRKKGTNEVCPENSIDNDPEKVLKTSQARRKLVVYKQQEYRQLEGIKEAGVEYGSCENLKISDLVAKTIEILECESIYKAALASNINAFYYSIQTQNTLETMNKKVATMEKQMAELMNSLNRQEWVGKEAEKNIARELTDSDDREKCVAG